MCLLPSFKALLSSAVAIHAILGADSQHNAESPGLLASSVGLSVLGHT